MGIWTLNPLLGLILLELVRWFYLHFDNICFLFCVLISSWRKQETMEGKQNWRAHQFTQRKKLGRRNQRKRKRARNHGKVLWFLGGNLAKKASREGETPVTILNLMFLRKGRVVLFLVQYIALAKILIESSGVKLLGL